jgi:hypothetical protein
MYSGKEFQSSGAAWEKARFPYDKTINHIK